MQPLRKVPFECRHCARQGWLLWSSPAADTCRLSAGIEALSEGFYMRMARTHRGEIEIICGACGTAQPDILGRVAADAPAPSPPDGKATSLR